MDTTHLRNRAIECARSGGWMRIPADPNNDADLLMTTAAEIIDDLRTALAEAQRENKALRADRDRLDFIERIYAHVQFRGKLNVWTVDCGLFYPEGIDGPKRELLFDSQDIREAIDRAIREARRGE